MNNRMLSNTEAAVHILTILREDLKQYPAFATPKYPLPAIMRTEQQIALLRQFGEHDGCDLACLGTDEDELDRFVRKARVLRARVYLRHLRRHEGDGRDARSLLLQMVQDGAVTLSDLWISNDELIKLVGGVP